MTRSKERKGAVSKWNGDDTNNYSSRHHHQQYQKPKTKEKKTRLTIGIVKHVQPRAPSDLSRNGHLGGSGLIVSLSETNRVAGPDLIELHVGVVIGPDDFAKVDRHLDVNDGLLDQVGRRHVGGYQAGISQPKFRRGEEPHLERQPAAGTADKVQPAGRIGRAHRVARPVDGLGHHLRLGNVPVGHAPGLHDGDVVLVEGEEVLDLEDRRGQVLGDAAQILRLAGHGQDGAAVGVEVDALVAGGDEVQLDGGGGRAGVADVGHAVLVAVEAGVVPIEDRVGTGIVGVGPGAVPGGRQVVV